MNKQLPPELADEIEKLGDEDVARVVTYARSLVSTTKRGARGSELRKYAGTIPKNELEQMRAAIEESCERVEPSQW